jgi:fructuronate reductase
VLVAPESPARLLAALTDPDIRIVTLTITEKGYTVDLGTGGLRAGDPDIVHDLANPATPRTALGFLAEAIERRRLAGVAPFTILSCDNLPSNGKTLRRVLTDFAALRSADLAAHIRDHVRCPSSMVDRIVPATADADRRAIAAEIGVDDAWPVLGETFGQWVIEDDFPSGRPALERHGVEFTTDVEPFERMKLRMLNGAHTALAAIGRLGGFETVSDAMADPSIRRFIAVYWRHVIPTLTTDPRKGEAYAARLAERFDNATLRHRTAQIASDASQKLPQRILSPLRDALDAGLPCLPLIFAVAAWVRSCGGLSDAGAPLPLNDPSFEAWADRPDQRSTAPVEVMLAYLRLGFVFGEDLPGRPAFVGPLQTCLEAIAARGVMAALKDLLADDAVRGA